MEVMNMTEEFDFETMVTKKGMKFLERIKLF